MRMFDASAIRRRWTYIMIDFAKIMQSITKSRNSHASRRPTFINSLLSSIKRMRECARVRALLATSILVYRQCTMLIGMLTFFATPEPDCGVGTGKARAEKLLLRTRLLLEDCCPLAKKWRLEERCPLVEEE